MLSTNNNNPQIDTKLKFFLDAKFNAINNPIKNVCFIRPDKNGKIMIAPKQSFYSKCVNITGAKTPEIDTWQEYNNSFKFDFIYALQNDKNHLKKLDNLSPSPVFYPNSIAQDQNDLTASFIKRLSANIFRDEFSDLSSLIYPQEILTDKNVPINFDYIESSKIIYSRIWDYKHKTTLLKFKQPQRILSSIDGMRTDITSVGNHYLPPATWWLNFAKSRKSLHQYILPILNCDPLSSAFLFTGVDIDNLSIVTKRHRDVSACAIVTAGVQSNGLRTGKDIGNFYEDTKIGTINCLLLTNTKLSPGAMTRTIITATEAKTAALQDLDIRSSQDPLNFQATGTGTDNIIVVQGSGKDIELTGGHTKMGEIIGNAVYQATIEAIKKQNNIYPQRSISQRLNERHIDLNYYINDEKLVKKVLKAIDEPQHYPLLNNALLGFTMQNQTVSSRLFSSGNLPKPLANAIATIIEELNNEF